MIGFEMHGEGTGGFRQRRAAWTEGSLLSLEVISFAGGAANKDKLGKFTRGTIKEIEAQFKKLAQARLPSVLSMAAGVTLFVSGDIKFKYYIDPEVSTERHVSVLLRLLAGKEGKIGDQVVIYLSAMIEDFVVLNMPPDPEEPLILKVNIDL